MTNFYKVKVERVTWDRGLHEGWEESICYTLHPEDAVETVKRRVEGIRDWWMRYGKGADGRPNVVAEPMRVEG